MHARIFPVIHIAHWGWRICGGGGLQMRQLELSHFWIFAYFLLLIEGERQQELLRSNEPWTSPFSLVVGPHTLHSALPWDAKLIYKYSYEKDIQVISSSMTHTLNTVFFV